METLEVQTDQGLRITLQLNSEYQIRRVERGGKKRLVVPVVMMVEGVHNGSRGPLLHLAEEFGRSPEDWNGIPVTIHHPEDENGEFISAESSGIISVGEVLNAHMGADKKLRAEAWLDEQILKDTGEIAWEAITNMNPLEISVGLYSQEVEETGEWNGETYNAVTRNPRPDHLALLPGETGACSWEDGCGIRANKEGGKNETMKTEKDEKLTVPNKEQYLVDLIANAESGYREIMSLIQSKLDAMDTDLKSYYTEDVFDDYFVYTVRSRENGTPLKFYKRGYSVNDSGTLEFAEEPTEVRKQTEYVALKEGGLIRTKFSNNNSKKEVNTMSEKEKKPCCEDVVDALIANKATKFADEDKTWLLTLEENQIAKIVQDEVEEEDPPKEEAPQLNAEQARQIVKDSIKTNEDFMELLPDEMKDHLTTGLALHKQRQEGMVKAIIANTEEGLWKEETLNEMDFNVLTKLYKSVNTTIANEDGADYSLNAEPVLNESVEEPLLPPGIKEVETVKE